MVKAITLFLTLVTTPVFASVNLQVDIPWDFEQMQQDASKIEASEVTYHFDFENEKHKTFLILNILDVASTIYAMENRDTLYETNFLLPRKPSPEELIIQKAVVISTMSYLGLFSTHPDDQWYINGLNATLGIVIVSNLYSINKYE
jgi:hypothetical protein